MRKDERKEREREREPSNNQEGYIERNADVVVVVAAFTAANNEQEEDDDDAKDDAMFNIVVIGVQWHYAR